MNTQLLANRINGNPRTSHQRRRFILSILLVLDALTLGGCITLVLVRQLLLDIMQRLVTVDAQVGILNVLDHLALYYVGYGGILLALILVTVSTWSWLRLKSRLRYNGILLSLVVIMVIAGLWLSRLL